MGIFGFDEVAYRTDYDAKTLHDRHDLGLSERSLIWLLKDNQISLVFTTCVAIM